MCNLNRDAEMALLTMGINLISQVIETSLTDNIPQSTNVLSAAANAYQQGKITKAQFVAVINALDEQMYQARAYAEPIKPINQLDLYRR